MYLYQAITSDFGLADRVKSDFSALNKSFNDLTPDVLKSVINLYDDGDDVHFFVFFGNRSKELDLRITDLLD